MRASCGLRVARTKVSLDAMMPRGVRLAAATLALATALVPRQCVADDTPALVIHYAGDTLTVRLSQVPLRDVLGEIGRQAGAEIRGGLLNPRDVSAEFDAVSLPEALHRLLGEQNFALVYGEGGRLRAVKLLGGPLGPPPVSFATANAPPVTVPDTPAGTTGALLGLIAAHPPVPITGRLAAAIGAETATLQQILDTSLHTDDATVRSDGIRRTLALVEAEPDLRAALLGTVKGMDDSNLVGLLRAVSPGHAEEITVHIATQSRVSELRVKASSVLQQLRAQKAGG